MAKINKKVYEIVANVKTPILAGFDTDTGVVATTVGYHQCEECKSSLVLNCLNAPACPVCAGSLALVSEDTNTELTVADFDNLQTIMACDTCSTTWKSKTETVSKMNGETMHCPSCTTLLTIKADESDENDNTDKTDTTTKPDTMADNKDTSTDDKSSDNTDTTEADKELDEALKKLKLKDTKSDDTSKDDSMTKTDDSKVESADGESGEHHVKRAKELHEKIMKTQDPDKKDVEDFNKHNKAAMDHHEAKADEAFDKDDGKGEREHNVEKRKHKKMQKEVDMHNKRYGGEDKGKSNIESSDDSDEDEDDDTDNNDNKDDDEELDASEVVYHMALSELKNAELVALPNYSNWYLFSNKSPVAVASFENADETVKRVFRSPEFSTTFTAAVAAEGVNPELMKDFGFKPLNVNVSVDKLSQKLIEEQVAEKVKDTQEKLDSLSEMFEQSLGTASMGIVKGFYDKDGGFRDGLIAQFASVRARDPEMLVESFLSNHLPQLMHSVVVVAKDLMNKSPEGLNEVASMVSQAKPRAIVAKKTETPALAIHSSLQTPAENPDNRNFKGEKVTATRVSGSDAVNALFSNIKDKTCVPPRH